MTGRLLSAGPPAWRHSTSVVIVGSGAAGLAAALRLAAARVPAVLITRAALRDSATDWAQGGLAAVWAEDDSAALHVDDTLIAGAGLCEPDIVAELVDAAPGAIRRLLDLGARFDAAGGRHDLHLEGGHQRRRILHAGDYSGAEVMRTLTTALARALTASDCTLDVRTDVRALDVLTDAGGSAAGVRVLADDGSVGDLLAPSVVLATGGVGQLWRGTSNPAVATGDGIAMAWRAGAVIRDLEFVQFHPTVLAVPGERGVLISEAVRGEGAVLIDRTGARVMTGVHPQADLAPRDVVSAAMHAHQQGTGEPHLYLDGTHLGTETWQRHFPTILTMCRAHGIDPITQPIPVQPGAHYLCGGVAADLTGRTSVPGLFAVGEVAGTGLHGANRLASNSVPEALVTGDRVGTLLASQPVLETVAAPSATPSFVGNPVRLIAPEGIDELRDAMTTGASVSRSAAGLAVTARRLAALGTIGWAAADAHDQLAPQDRLARPDTAGELTPAAIDATNLHTVATLLVAAAQARTESRGAHRRVDHPDTDPAWARHLTLRRDSAGALDLATQSLGGVSTETEAA